MDTTPDDFDSDALDDPDTGHRYRRGYDVAYRALEVRCHRDGGMFHGSPAARWLHLDLADAIRIELGDAAEDPRVRAGVRDAMEGRVPRFC
jgi:hypothetical protein